MAIDTENKRRSIGHVLPIPNNNIIQADRQQVAWIYSGILSSSSAPGSPARVYDVLVEDRVLAISENRVSDVLAEDRIFKVNSP